MARKQREDGRIRTRVNVEFSAEQYAQVVMKAGLRSLSEFCRERVLLSERFHDPLFEVSAKLSGLAVKVNDVAAFIDRWDARRLSELIESGKTGQFGVESEFQDVIYACLELVREVSRQARDVSRTVAASAREARAIPAVKPGNLKP